MHEQDQCKHGYALCEAEDGLKADVEGYSYAVWSTQGGGMIRYIGDTPVFIEAPLDVPGLTVGDTMPKEWGIVPANRLARQEMEEADPMRLADF